MRIAHRLFALVVTAVPLGTTACVGATNAYDLDADPQAQARARISGRVVLDDPNAATAEQRASLATQVALVVVTLRDAAGIEIGQVGGADLELAAATAGDDATSAAVGFAFGDLVPGAVSLAVTGVGTRFLPPAFAPIELLPGADLDVGDVRFVVPLSPDGGPGTIGGTVTAEGGDGPKRVELFALADGEVVSRRVLTTDDVGTFSFTGLDVGTYAIAAGAEAYTPGFAMDIAVGEEPGAALVHSLVGDGALTLEPVTAVLRFPDEVLLVEGARYTANDAVPVDVLAFGRPSPVTGMRLATNTTFLDEAGAELAFVDYAATTSITLPDDDGPADIYAQFEVRSPGGFRFVSDVFSARVVKDQTAPIIDNVTLTGAVTGSDGAVYVTAATVDTALQIDAIDVHSAVAAVAVVLAEVAPDPQALVYQSVSSPGGSVRVVAAAPLGEGDGARRAWIVVKDRAGNASAPRSFDFVVDTSAPTVSRFAIDDGASHALSPLVAITVETADTDVAFVALATSGTPTAFVPFSPGAPISFSLDPGDGVRSAVVRVRDAAGNVSAPLSDDIVVDAGFSLDVAELVASRAVPARVTGRAVARARVVLGEIDDDGLDLLEGAPFADNLDVVLTAPDDGAFRVFAQAEDEGGARSPIVVADVVVDTVAPAFIGDTPVLIDADAVATRFVSATVTIASGGDATRMAVTTDGVVDSEVFQPFAPVVTALLPPGDCEDALLPECKSVCVILEDDAGNRSELACDAIRLDTTPPSAPTINPLFGTVRARLVEISIVEAAEDIFGPVTRYEISGVGNEFTEIEGSGPFVFSLRRNRDNTLCVRGKDDAGNVGIEDCAVVTEETTRLEISAGINNQGSDIYGDFLAFSGRGGIWLHDVRLGPPTSINDDVRLRFLTDGLGGPGAPGGEHSGAGSLVRMAGDVKSLVITHGPVGPNDDLHVNVVLLALDAFVGPGRDLDPQTPPGPGYEGFEDLIEGQLPGYAIDSDGAIVAWFDAPTFTATGRVRVRSVGDGSPFLDVATERIVSGASAIELCKATGPRVMKNVVVWCQKDAGRERMMRARIAKVGDTPDTPVELTLATAKVAAIRQGVLGSDPSRIGGTQQPLLSERYIAWAEEDVAGSAVRLVYFTDKTDAAVTPASLPTQRRVLAFDGPATGDGCPGTMTLDLLQDMSGARVAFQFLRDDELGLSDIAFFDLDLKDSSLIAGSGLVCVTNDLPPNDYASLDGTRLIYRDQGNSESIALIDLSRMRWLSAGPELAFQPVTSGYDGGAGLTAWLATHPLLCSDDAQCVGGATCEAGACTDARRRVTLLARHLAGDAFGQTIVVTQDPVFGVGEGDRSFAVGGKTIAWLSPSTTNAPFSPPPYTLSLRSLTSQAAAQTRAGIGNAFAVDPEGTRIAFVEYAPDADPNDGEDTGEGRLHLAAATNLASSQLIDGVLGSIPHVDVETKDGETFVVWQKGGSINDRDATGFLTVWRTSAPTPTVLGVETDEGVLLIDDDEAYVRAPKIARVGDDLWIAYLYGAPELPGGGRPSLVAHACRWNLTKGLCDRDVPLAFAEAQARNVSISRDGLVAFRSDEEELDQVIVYDVRAARRVFATPVVPADGDRSTPDIAGGHLVWTDASLGTLDVFELLLAL